MYLVVNKDNRIVASAGYEINAEDCAKRQEKVIYIDDSFYVSKMVGAIYIEHEPYFIEAPSPYHKIVNGDYVLDEEGTANYWKAVRTFRNKLIAQTDWTQLSDVTISQEEAEKWLLVRQELRNITNETSDPESAFTVLESYAKQIMGNI